MNDGHYCQKISHPSESVFISRFHLEHLDCRLGQEHYDGWVAWLCDDIWTTRGKHEGKGCRCW